MSNVKTPIEEAFTYTSEPQTLGYVPRTWGSTYLKVLGLFFCLVSEVGDTCFEEDIVPSIELLDV